MTNHWSLYFKTFQVSNNSFLHKKVNKIDTKNHLMLTTSNGETSPTAALPAIVLKAQNNEVKVNKKCALVNIFMQKLCLKGT